MWARDERDDLQQLWCACAAVVAMLVGCLLPIGLRRFRDEGRGFGTTRRSHDLDNAMHAWLYVWKAIAAPCATPMSELAKRFARLMPTQSFRQLERDLLNES